MQSALALKYALRPFKFFPSFVSVGVRYLGTVAQVGASSAALSPSYVSVNQVVTFHSSSRAYQRIASQHIRQMTSGLTGHGSHGYFFFVSDLLLKLLQNIRSKRSLCGCNYMVLLLQTILSAKQ